VLVAALNVRLLLLLAVECVRGRGVGAGEPPPASHGLRSRLPLAVLAEGKAGRGNAVKSTRPLKANAHGKEARGCSTLI